MNVALIFPPQGHFTQPYLSVPSLSAYLRAQGIHCWVNDANIEAYDYFLESGRLALSLERVRERARLAELEGRSELIFSELEDYQRISEIELVGDALVAGIDEAVGVLRSSEEFYNYERYLWAGRTVEQALRLISAEFAPSRLTAHGFVMRYRIERTSDILAATQNERENPYIEFFREVTLPKLQEQDPDLVGISVTFGSQAIPALTLAGMIKAWKPECHITLGGGLLAYTAEKLAKRDELWDVVDSMVLLEGERPLHQLTEVAAGKRELSEVSNILYRDAAGVVQATAQIDPLNIQELPTPDFDGMPLHLYYSPELTLPLAITRGCYWGKCVFCTLYTVIGPGYRGRGIDQTIEDIRFLSEKYGTKSFYMVIEDLPPNMAKQLPDKILEAGLDINWWCDARLEHEAFTEEVCQKLAQSGCKRMAFGYESASERVLTAMCKGIDPKASMELVHRVRDAGISVTLYVMVGFPTETAAEAEETLATLMEHQDAIQEVSVRVFYLDEVSEVFKEREKFDIVEVFPDPEADLQVYYDFLCKSGMTRPEARQMYLRFTEALRTHFPVFQNTNMLYHELKSHYFLYLVKHGSWEALCANVLEVERPSGLPAHPTPRRGLVLLPLNFDRETVDRMLGETDSAQVRPRYQADLFDPRDLVRLDGELDAVPKSSSVLVYDPVTGEVHCCSPAAAALLERCDGKRSVEDVVSIIPAAHREAAVGCVEEFVAVGLLEGVGS